MTNHTIPGSWTEIGATDVTEDIKILTANYLAALKSNSDEIARLAKALRAAEAMNSQLAQQRLEAEERTANALEQRDAARADAERLDIALDQAAQCLELRPDAPYDKKQAYPKDSAYGIIQIG